MMTTDPSVLSPDIFSKIKILVVGDCMLNHYLHGEVSRISPEGPFPILSIKNETYDAGGAAGVAANLQALGVSARLIGLVGDDTAAANLQSLCSESACFLTVQDRPTIVKTRLVGNDSQMMRADREKILPLSSADEEKLIALIKEEIDRADALILSDYAKGCLTRGVISAAIEAAKNKGIPTFVDPKGKDFSIYRGADIVTPNRKELAEATNLPVSNDSEIEAAAKNCLENSGIAGIVATRSEQGMTILAQYDAAPVHIRTEAREVFDVSGAGDTVIATLAACRAAGLSLEEAARVANRAAGIVVSRKGVCVIAAEELFGKKVGLGYLECVAAKKLVDSWKALGLKVGFTNGCFDILHAGHVTYLAEARSYCDRLVLGLNHDNSVRVLKGPTRPVNDEASRAIVMSALSSVDCVVLFGAEKAGEDNTPCKLLEFLQPDVYFKGGDYTEAQLPEAKIVKAYGGEVKLMGLVDGKSTTNIINKIAAA